MNTTFDSPHRPTKAQKRVLRKISERGRLTAIPGNGTGEAPLDLSAPDYDREMHFANLLASGLITFGEYSRSYVLTQQGAARAARLLAAKSRVAG